jgi:hypothetical protein
METIIDKYKIVFEDMVKTYLNDLEDKVELTDNEIKQIAFNLLYKHETLWEYINEHIDYEIGKVLLERKDK